MFLLSSCDAAPDAGEKDEIVEGVNLTQLFAEPEPSEIAAILEGWQQRDVSVQGYMEEYDARLGFGGRAVQARIISHTVGEARHYGAILTPEGALPRSLPVLVYAHGGADGVNVDEALLYLGAGLPGAQNSFAVVVPSFRSEPLTFGQNRYVSTGAPSPWDYDVDDALALLNAALETTPAANPERIGVIGLSRGAGVGLLMAIRDPRIDQVVEFFGPTDFTGVYVQDIVRGALQGRPRSLPGVDYLNTAFIQPLRQGNVTVEQVRPELIRRSAVFFANRLPMVQVHHGTADDVVSVTQAQALIDAMQAQNRTAPDFEHYLYPGGGHNPLTLPRSLDRTGLFLVRLLSPGAFAPAAHSFSTPGRFRPYRRTG